VHPILTQAFELKLKSWIQWKLNTLVEKLRDGAEEALRRNGHSS
jgi:hypothetical protein